MYEKPSTNCFRVVKMSMNTSRLNKYLLDPKFYTPRSKKKVFKEGLFFVKMVFKKHIRVTLKLYQAFQHLELYFLLLTSSYIRIYFMFVENNRLHYVFHFDLKKQEFQKEGTFFNTTTIEHLTPYVARLRVNVLQFSCFPFGNKSFLFLLFFSSDF